MAAQAAIAVEETKSGLAADQPEELKVSTSGVTPSARGADDGEKVKLPSQRPGTRMRTKKVAQASDADDKGEKEDSSGDEDEYGTSSVDHSKPTRDEDESSSGSSEDQEEERKSRKKRLTRCESKRPREESNEMKAEEPRQHLMAKRKNATFAKRHRIRVELR